MHSPFESESEAYRFVLYAIPAVAAIVVASLLFGPWAGVPAWGVLTLVVVVWYARRGRAKRGLRTAPAHVGGPDERRIVVVAFEAPSAEAIGELLRASAGGPVQALVVCPAPASRMRHWTSDVDSARARAQRTLEASVAALEQAGIECRGEIGDEDPLRAVEDALRTFGGDEILVAGQSELMGTRARERFALPVVHVGGQAA